MSATNAWNALDDGWKASLEEACSRGVTARPASRGGVDRHGVVVAEIATGGTTRGSVTAGGFPHRARGDVRALLASSGNYDDYTLYTTFEPC